MTFISLCILCKVSFDKTGVKKKKIWKKKNIYIFYNRESMYNAKVYIFDQHTFTISQRHSVTCDSSVNDKSTPAHGELHMLFYPLHPAGGIRGYYAKEGETREGQWELPESQGGRNSCFISTTAFALWMCTSNKGPVNHSMWAGMLCLCHSRPWCGAFVLVSSPVGAFSAQNNCIKWLLSQQ